MPTGARVRFCFTHFLRNNMLASDMNGNDRQIIHRALGIPMRRLDIPQKILDLYEKAMYVRNVNSQTGGSLPDGVLMTILMVCSDCIELPTAKPTKYGHLPTGTKMWFQESVWLIIEVEFVCIKDPVGRTYSVKYAGGLRTVGEAQLFLEDPRQKTTVPVPEKPAVAAVAPEDDPALAAKRLDILNKIKARWTLGKPVEACAPSTAAFTGTVCGYDDRGNIVVRRPDGSETAVLCDYLYPCAEPEIVLAADQPRSVAPIETDEDDGDIPADDSDVMPAAEDAKQIAARVATLFPKGEAVEVCVPGSPDWTGTVQGHGGGRMLGRVQVIPDVAGDKAYLWVVAQHLYRVKDFVGSRPE
jgi:hypothetical protein